MSDFGGPEQGGKWAGASRFILVLLIVFTAKQLFSVAAFSPFSGHDELAHFSYAQTLATEWRVPKLPDLEAWRAELNGGEPPPTDNLPTSLYDYCRFTLDWYCEPESPRWSRDPPRIVTVPGVGYFPSGYQYVANHPPLYYVAMAPILKASSGLSPLAQHYLLRIAAIPFGLLVVYAAYRMTRVLFPGDAFLAATVPTLVAFQPQIGYEAAMVNNDIVAIAIISLLLWGVVAGIRDGFPTRLCLALGVGLGAGLLTKGTTIAIVPVVGLALLMGIGLRDWKRLLISGVAVLAPAVVLASPWYLYLLRTYGDFSGLSRVKELQYWNSPMGSFLELLASPRFFANRFNESWGEYGWRLIHFDTILLWLIGGPLLIGVVGLVIFGVRVWNSRSGEDAHRVRIEPWQLKALVSLILTCLLAYLAVIQFGTDFALAQARYYFPIVNAAALLVMLGWRTLIPPYYRPYGQGVVVAALLALNVYIFAAYVLPFTVTIGEPVVNWRWNG